ncbi:MAG: hypothetical protein HY297_03460 [Thaumarchaeota archaeon]|nr:hypothetical protein [Nitrososphaerota archaeon]
MKYFCISHVKDVDGLGAAALVSVATGAEVLLSDYDDLLHNLSLVPMDVDHFVLCDLGADNANLGDFLGKMAELSGRAKVTYVDHHFMDGPTKRKLRRSGVKLVHDVEECSSILVFREFGSHLPPRARLLALLGAVTDYQDGSPLASKLMEQEDRQFVLLEASMLSYALGRKAREKGFAEQVVRKLSSMKLPHEIEGVPQAAVQQLDEVAKLGAVVRRKGLKLGRLAYMVTTQYSTGNVAKLLIGAFGVPVGVAMKEKKEGWYEVSLRSTSECRVHLGQTAGMIAGKLGGSGGGHRKAAGCRVPVDGAEEFLAALSKKV